MASVMVISEQRKAQRRRYIDWEEENFLSEKGNKVVRYYLKDRHGNLTLAVVGSEKGLRHIVYTVSENFLRFTNSKSAAMKWKSRREVIDWLSSFLSKPLQPVGEQPDLNLRKSVTTKRLTHSSTDASNGETFKANQSKFQLQLHKNAWTCRRFAWLGPSWTCKKSLFHYRSFRCNNVTIAVYDFVYIKTEGKQRRIAHLEDMFEDVTGGKFVRVRWFSRNTDILENIPPPSPHAKELFLTSHREVIAVDRVDGHATVLSGGHFEDCFSKLREGATGDCYLCFRHIDNDVIKPFNICRMEGYWRQKALSSADSYSVKVDTFSGCKDFKEVQDTELDATFRKGFRKSKRSRRQNTSEQNEGETIADKLKSCSRSSKSDTFSDFNIGDNIEVLSQDSGIRGCWFRCQIIDKEAHTLKVRYEDVLNDDESDKLEEWVLLYRIADNDKFGIRVPGRLTIRPCPPEEFLFKISVGTAVDAWWNDGWWEGIVVQINGAEPRFHVYFTGEDEVSAFDRRDLRLSREWVSNQWKSLEVSPALVASLSNTESEIMHGRQTPSSVLDEWATSISSDSKSPSAATIVRQSSGIEKSGNSHMNGSSSDLKDDLVLDSGCSKSELHVYDLSKDELLAELKWRSSRKRSGARESARDAIVNPSRAKRLKLVHSKTSESDSMTNRSASVETGTASINSTQYEEDRLKESRLKQTHTNISSSHGCPLGSSLFRSTLPLSNLVLSR